MKARTSIRRRAISIIVPVWNEVGTISDLVLRTDARLRSAQIDYEILFIDDCSTDGTYAAIEAMMRDYPIRVFSKSDPRERGKWKSVSLGVKKSRYPIVALLDADLQYPPEAIPAMLEKMDHAGVVVANRKTYTASWLRRLASRLNARIFGKMLHGISEDIQSGLKVFRKDIMDHIPASALTSWAADLTLLTTARDLGYGIDSVPIDFSDRRSGVSKVKMLDVTWSIVSNALRLKLKPHTSYHIPPDTDKNMAGAGVVYRGKRFITHSTLAHHKSALMTLRRHQKIALVLLLAVLTISTIASFHTTLLIVVGLLSLFYFLDVLFNLYLVVKSLYMPPEITVSEEERTALIDADLPIYTIMCPLYKEGDVLPQFVSAISNMDWPKEKLDVQLLLEADDLSTIQAAEQMGLPPYIHVLVVPDSQPKTKPKACNYGLAYAKGAYIVVYDAEDVPDPLQLKKTYIGFQRSPENVVCLQAKLNYYNPNHNLLTRLFTAEYSLWFDVILTGLQSINTTIPLGGTSNHFKTDVLRRLEGWDPFNVTEDCDLGARLFHEGYRTAIVDSTTEEEANSDVGNWIRQRSRWIKGYIQTYFVHMQHPGAFIRTHGIHAFLFQMTVGGKIGFIFINPILWLVTLSYFYLYRYVGPTIESFYPPMVFYMAVTSLVFGNFFCMYYYMIGCAKRGHYHLIKYVFIVPLYWLLVSVAGCKGLFQLLSKPHYWEKTVHGLHIAHAAADEARNEAKKNIASGRALQFQKLADFGRSSSVRGGVLIAALLVGNILNFLYNAYLGRAVTIEQFGLISLMGAFLSMSQVPYSALSRTVTHKSAYLLGSYGRPIMSFWSWIRSESTVYAIGISLLWFICIPMLRLAFHADTYLPFLLFTPVWVIGMLAGVDGGFLGGNLKFGTLAILTVLEAGTKLVVSILLVEYGLGQYVYSAIPISMSLSLLYGWIAVRRMKSDRRDDAAENNTAVFPKAFFVSSLLTTLTGMTYLSLDIVLVNYFVTPTEAGHYGLLTLVGKMVFMLGSMFSGFVIPMVSHDLGAGKKSKTAFVILGLVVTVNTAAFCIFGIFGSVVVPVLWGAKTLAILPYLPMFTLAMALYGISATIVTIEQVHGKYHLTVVTLLLGCLQIIGILLFHGSILEITRVVLLSAIAMLIGIGFYLQLYDVLRVMYHNTIDFFGLFGRLPHIERLPNGNLRILLFNWRDTKHVWAGGAEEYLHQLARRWVRMGHEVTLFTSNDGKNARYETIDGVRIIRRGGQFSVYVWAYVYYRFRLRGTYDVIVDSENGIPFFTPIYASEQVFLLIHHVHQEVFRRSLRPPLSWIAMFLERRLMPEVYKNTEVITVSPSSKADILIHKLTKKDPHVIYNGVDFAYCKPGKKDPRPLVLYLGRLTGLKSLPVFIHAAMRIITRIPDAHFIIAGDGPDKHRLERLVRKLNLEHVVSFTGRVSDAEKLSLYQRAWVFLNPSLIEGWGITTIEANACATPVVASNVQGLRDSVHNPHSGFLVPYGNIEEFAKNIETLLTNDTLRTRMSKESVRWARKFDWEKSAKEAITVLKAHI